MQKAAFRIVSIVILTQLLMVCLAIGKCIWHNNAECAHGKAQEYFAMILTQSLALYAAEKGRKDVGN